MKINTPIMPHQQQALLFLRSHLPQSDLDCYDEALLLRFVDHALMLRRKASWCAHLDEDVFLHYVLFPRVNDEDLSFHREIFFNALWDRIAPLSTLEEKALEVNRWCCEMVTYEMQDDRTASPLTVWRCGSGRCGEESAFAVSALRSVGIPARQVYSPRWAHCDDNHAWVEVLCGDEWKFFGACESEPVLNRGWFNTPASRALLVHSRLFGESNHPLHGEKLGSEGCVSWYNQTARYALTRRHTLRAVVDGQTAAGAVFRIQVLNEASFHTIATLTADERGEATVELGLGDFHVLAQLGSLCAEGDCRGETELTLSLISLPHADTDWQEADYLAPADVPVNPSPLTAAQKKERAATLARCRALREARIADMLSEESAADELLRAALANADEVASLLYGGDKAQHRAVLHTLSEKDLRDVTAHILLSHMAHLPPQGDLQDSLYFPYVACPRIELEKLTPWRESLCTAFDEDTKARYRSDPVALIAALRSQVTISCDHIYTNLICTPAEAWKLRRCDARSFRVLTVAMLRTLGVPSRLRSLDGVPEFWQGKTWHPAWDEANCTLLVRGKDASYRQNWSLSRWEEHSWKLLHPCLPSVFSGEIELDLPAGRYRLTTSVRMPNGNQFAAWREITLSEGERREVDIHLRSYELGEMLCSRQLAQISAVTLGGETVDDICQGAKRTQLLLWCEEGGEPTEHILVELTQLRESFGSLPVDIVFLLRSIDSLRNSALSAAAQALSAHCLIAEDWELDLEQTARHLTCDPDTPPLVVICDRGGNAVYGMSGYHVGAAQLLLQIAEYIAKQ